MARSLINGALMKLQIFDDPHRAAFFPLTHLRSTGDLRCGILKLRQRLESLFAEDAGYIISPELVELYQERHPDWLINQAVIEDCLYVNSRLKPESEAYQLVSDLKPETALVNRDLVLAFRSSSGIAFCPDVTSLTALSIEIIQTDLPYYRHPSDLIQDNSRLIRYDFEHYFQDKDNFFETEPGVTVLDPYNIWIGDNVKLKPGLVLDASDGPIVIDDEATIMANSVIIGPCYIGKGSMIKIGAKIYEGCSIGPVCKIGGEVEDSIIQAYSNKQHDGFLGHAYLGEWINLGADTNNSDLKNTYKNVSYYSYDHGKKIDSGTLFLGCIIGDHVKLGINCTVNTGAVIGTGCNLWGRDLISDFIPDFSWGEASALSAYRLEAFLETAKTVKNRRKLSLSSSESQLLSYISQRRLQEKPKS